MTELQRNNEEKIFSAIQDLKDSIFGLNNSYVNFCYEYSENFHYLNEEKMDSFISELIELSRNTNTYKNEFESLIKDLLYMEIKYIQHFCPFNDQTFASLRKIAETVYKPNAEYKSTFDVLIGDQKDFLDLIFIEKYDNFTQEIINVDFNEFYKCIKHALEAFIDNHNLNCLNDEAATSNMVFKISRLSQRIQFDTRQRNTQR